jgi:hypothetical protein
MPFHHNDNAIIYLCSRFLRADIKVRSYWGCLGFVLMVIMFGSIKIFDIVFLGITGLPTE